MKQFVKIALSLFVALLSFAHLQAQDVIHRKNGKTLEVKVLEINGDDVKYKLFTQPDGITYAMDVTLIKKIVFANGTVQKFEHDSNFDNPEFYDGQNKSAYKISFLSQLAGYTTFTYEHSMKPGKSIEGRLGIVGLGRDLVQEKPRGVFGGFGYKFYYRPDSYTSRQRYSHLLKGWFIRPEINLGAYSVSKTTFVYTGTGVNTVASNNRVSTVYGSINLAGGKQWIFDNKFGVELFYGVGMGLLSGSKSNSSIDNLFSATKYGNTVTRNGLAINGGLNISILGK